MLAVQTSNRGYWTSPITLMRSFGPVHCRFCAVPRPSATEMSSPELCERTRFYSVIKESLSLLSPILFSILVLTTPKPSNGRTCCLWLLLGVRVGSRL